MGDHEFCRLMYGATCKEAGISQRLFTSYRYTQMGYTPQFQVYRDRKIIGDFSGCCAYAAKTEGIKEYQDTVRRAAQADDTPGGALIGSPKYGTKVKFTDHQGNIRLGNFLGLYEYPGEPIGLQVRNRYYRGRGFNIIKPAVVIKTAASYTPLEGEDVYPFDMNQGKI